jgi:uncharacterized phage protein (TIGR02216 family)
MSEPQAFPWDDAMMLALGVLRWSPDEFWRATPRELTTAWEGLNGGRPMEPALGRDLRRLMEAFPDERGVGGLSASSERPS